ncbi:hypothetical protein MESS2_220036 [Mesorhizobium metallidurans STM 2683]|uniref:Uncharacterized protein n=1 Tax=Mesorhizobium metallidurans STM 2683 TaxID=1297569 RepID=M5EMS6_9HYPH|nr:hypothetical protein MESS2_220036 [Mesorhizobium metallidurans STM 2683]
MPSRRRAMRFGIEALEKRGGGIFRSSPDFAVRRSPGAFIASQRRLALTIDVTSGGWFFRCWPLPH